MQPYPNPYYFQPYQPMDRPAQYQPTYQTTYQYQPQQVTAPAVPQALNGKFVDSIESVKATDVMMDGSIMFFPATDGKAIYTKQLQADGTSMRGYSRNGGGDPYDEYMTTKQSYRSGEKSPECKQRMIGALEEHLDELTEEIAMLGRDADCAEEKNTIMRYIDKLKRMM